MVHRLGPAFRLCGRHTLWLHEKERILKRRPLQRSKVSWLSDVSSVIQECYFFVIVPARTPALVAGEMPGVLENGLQIDLEDLEAKLPGPPCRVPQFLARHCTGMMLDKLVPEVPNGFGVLP